MSTRPHARPPLVYRQHARMASPRDCKDSVRPATRRRHVQDSRVRGVCEDVSLPRASIRGSSVRHRTRKLRPECVVRPPTPSITTTEPRRLRRVPDPVISTRATVSVVVGAAATRDRTDHRRHERERARHDRTGCRCEPTHGQRTTASLIFLPTGVTCRWNFSSAPSTPAASATSCDMCRVGISNFRPACFSAFDCHASSDR